jgi:hypothetical protein
MPQGDQMGAVPGAHHGLLLPFLPVGSARACVRSGLSGAMVGSALHADPKGYPEPEQFVTMSSRPFGMKVKLV